MFNFHSMSVRAKEDVKQIIQPAQYHNLFHACLVLLARVYSYVRTYSISVLSCHETLVCLTENGQQPYLYSFVKTGKKKKKKLNAIDFTAYLGRIYTSL